MISNKKINVESKSTLARLLATENLNVIHDAATDTAYFDLNTRDITLPILKDMRGYVYNAFIAHEVAHALYTPVEEYKRTAESVVPPAYINITEDARIERLIQDKYPGTKKEFYAFYKEFSSKERDFFGLSEIDDISKLALIDRINLHFKIGRFINVPFTVEEQKYVDMVTNEVSFDDAIEAAKAIFEYDKQNNKQHISESDLQYVDGGEAEDGEGEAGGKKAQKIPDHLKGAGRTQKAFDNNFKTSLTEQDNTATAGGIEPITTDKLKGSLLTLADIMSKPGYGVWDNRNDNKYVEFSSKIKPVVNAMVTRFNMKQSAKDFNKTRYSTSGVINDKKLALYSTHDNIFLQNEILPNGKNHGFFMILDWSSSMSSHTQGTIQQMLVFSEFCRKINIPFVVYGFTSNNSIDSGEFERRKNQREHKRGSIDFAPEDNAIVFEILNNTLSRKDYQEHVKCLYQSNRNFFPTMGSTPTTSSLLLLQNSIRSFKESNNIEKLSMIVVTDGSATDRYDAKRDVRKIKIKNPKTHEFYSCDNSPRDVFHTVLKYIKDVEDINKVIGFYVTSTFSDMLNGSLKYFPDNTRPDRYEDIQGTIVDFREKNSVRIGGSYAFDDYYVVNMNAFNNPERSPLSSVTAHSSETLKRKKFISKLTDTKKSLVFMNTVIDHIA